MNSQNQVESTLKEILEVVKPLHEDWVTRFKIINELREVVQSIENLRASVVGSYPALSFKASSLNICASSV
ncbi:hypothetical protein V6Z11_A06G167200 [Gossypium hirsutum]